MNTEQDAYVPGMEHEGITVFMMGTVMVEYNRKPMPLMGNPQGKMLQLFLILLYAGDKGVLREELLDMLYGNGENTNPSGRPWRAVACRSMNTYARTAAYTGGTEEGCLCILMQRTLR